MPMSAKGHGQAVEFFEGALQQKIFRCSVYAGSLEIGAKESGTDFYPSVCFADIQIGCCAHRVATVFIDDRERCHLPLGLESEPARYLSVHALCRRGLSKPHLIQ